MCASLVAPGAVTCAVITGQNIVMQMQLSDSRNKTLVKRIRFADKVVYRHIPTWIM